MTKQQSAPVQLARKEGELCHCPEPFPWMELLSPIGRLSNSVTHDFAKWEGEIAAFEQADAVEPPPKHATVFTGSSSIGMWQTLAADFPQHQVINRGFGGSELIDSLHFADRIVFPYEPRMVVLYAGSNDINTGTSPEEIFASFCALAEKLRAKLPETDLAYISIVGNPARWTQVEKVSAANALVKNYIEQHPRMLFIDVFTRMLDPHGLPRPELFVADQVHMNAEGYKIWAEAVRPLLPAPRSG